MKDEISTYIWPGQTHFGYGAATLVAREISSMGARHAFIITDPGIIAAGLLAPVTESLSSSDITYTVFDQVPANPHISAVDAATRLFRDCSADVVVAVGGGSVLDAAKAIRLAAGGPTSASIGDFAPYLGEKALPVPPQHQMPAMIAIPTTAGTGSEVTPWGVLTDLDRKLKFGIGGNNLMPNIALVDPDLTLTLPAMLTAATGLDALSHCIEAYVSTKQNPALDPMILKGIELIGRSLRTAVSQPSDRQARHDMMLASMIGGIAISSRWLGACHSLAHQLSSFADLHHGVAIALMLPHQIEYSLPGAVERYGEIAVALVGLADQQIISTKPGSQERAKRAVTALRELIADIGLPSRLSETGISADLIPSMAHHAFKLDGNWPTNPWPVDESDLENLYQRAY